MTAGLAIEMKSDHLNPFPENEKEREILPQIFRSKEETQSESTEEEGVR